MSHKDYDANKLFEAGGIFLFFDVPQNSEFGIDYNCWKTGENFKGVKMIPPGIHFIYFSVSDKYGNIGIRSGFFHDFKVKQVIAKKWNQQSETMEDYIMSEDQIQNFQQRKQEFDKFLGAYPYDEYKRWMSLTNCITSDLLNILEPENKIISSGSCLVGKKFTITRSPEKKKDKVEIFKVPSDLKEAEQRLPKMQHEKYTNIRFSKIQEDIFPQEVSPVEITAQHIDLSHKLEHFIADQSGKNKNWIPMNILGELQFAFICFLIGHVYDALEQWKFLVNLLCNSENLVKKYPELFSQFVQVLFFELKEMPEDFFTDIITSNNFLTVNLHNFFDNVKSVADESIDGNEQITRLSGKCANFKKYLKEKFGFDFEEEPDEYAPVVCQDVD
ncbi:AAR2 -like protein [Brachionus plicatilis]|uniref:Protein AAR2 homolog n=1 Tax=Brachionus plicatilis TaxID=10195 RepID=A0A3M7R046_BRAPC|nr:AAR2 -like protein [Brachionus plicatilis]